MALNFKLNLTLQNLFKVYAQLGTAKFTGRLMIRAVIQGGAGRHRHRRAGLHFTGGRKMFALKILRR